MNNFIVIFTIFLVAIVGWYFVSDFLVQWEHKKLMSDKNREKYMQILHNEYGISIEKIADMTTEKLYESVAVMKATRS